MTKERGIWPHRNPGKAADGWFIVKAPDPDDPAKRFEVEHPGPCIEDARQYRLQLLEAIRQARTGDYRELYRLLARTRSTRRKRKSKGA